MNIQIDAKAIRFFGTEQHKSLHIPIHVQINCFWKDIFSKRNNIFKKSFIKGVKLS